MKFKILLLPLFFLFFILPVYSQLPVDTLISLPGSTVYGTRILSMQGSQKSIAPLTSPALVNGTVAETFKQIPALVTDMEGASLTVGLIRLRCYYIGFLMDCWRSITEIS